MKRGILIVSLFFILFSCKKDDEITDDLSSIKSAVSRAFDSKATFTYSQYEEILSILSDDKFIVLPLIEMNDSINNEKVIVGLRHDIDCNPFKALQMAELEKNHGLRASYYILPTAMYYGQFKKSGFVRFYSMGQVYEELASYNVEIGLHNDLLNVQLYHNLDPYEFNRNDIEYFNSINIPIHGTSAHGNENILKLGLVNYEVFSDFNKHPEFKFFGKTYLLGVESLKECGYLYEAYFVHSNIYFTDGGGKFPGGIEAVKKMLVESQPGDRVQLLTHPLYWGK